MAADVVNCIPFSNEGHNHQISCGSKWSKRVGTVAIDQRLANVSTPGASFKIKLGYRVFTSTKSKQGTITTMLVLLQDKAVTYIRVVTTFAKPVPEAVVS